jgi:uncharacterized membrane protein
MFRYFASIFSDEKNFLTVSAVFLALGANLSILLDVPVLRQLFGFAFLTMLPGILLLRYFKMRRGLSRRNHLVLGVKCNLRNVLYANADANAE